MKRLLSIATLYPNAHTPRFGTFVARSLEALAAREDWEVTVINPIGIPPVPFGHYRPLADAARDGREGGVDVRRPIFTLVPRLSGRFNPGSIARTIMPLAKQLHAEQPFDLVDAQFFYPDGPVAAWVARVLDLPFAVKARGADISYWGAKAYGRKAICDTATRAAQVIAVSEALADDVAALGVARDSIAVHYTGLDHGLFHPRPRDEARRALAETHGIPADASLVASVGALIERKGQSLVLQALAEVPDTRLVLVGEGEDRPKLEAQARELGLADRVHLLGNLPQQDIASVLSAASAMVLPSASEGLANAWVEALACGCPLVISDVGGARELVRSDSAGRLVARDPAAIAQGIRATLAAAPSQAEVAATVSEFSWQAHAEKLDALYSGIIGTKA